MVKEATASIKINRLLEAAGWRFFPDGNGRANIQLELHVTIKTQDLDALGEDFEKTSKGFIDFLLLNERGFPFIVLEAKAEDKNPLVGLRESSAKMIPAKSVVVSTRATIGRIAINRVPIATNQGFKNVVIEDSARVVPEFVALALTRLVPTMQAWATGGTFKEISKSKFCELQIPLPPLAVQKEIVAEIEGYQKVIDGARAVLDNYRPHIPIDPDWPIPTFEAAPFQIIDGDRGTNYPSKEDFSSSGCCLFLNTKNIRSDGFKFDELELISLEKDHALRKGKLERGDVLLTTRGTIGNTALYDASVEFEHIRINSGMLIFRPDPTKLSSSYLFHFFQSETFQAQREAIVSGAAQPQPPLRSLNETRIPLPRLATQQTIVAEIEAEQALVAANRELIARFERKIQAVIARVWGEEGKPAG